MRALLLLIVLSGCASKGTDLSDVALNDREPGCARQCLAKYSDCSGQASRAFGIANTDNILAACKSSLKACAGTCPAR